MIECIPNFDDNTPHGAYRTVGEKQTVGHPEKQQMCARLSALYLLSFRPIPRPESCESAGLSVRLCH